MTAARQMNFAPRKGEQVSEWATRFNVTFRTMPTDKHVAATNHWVGVTIASNADGTEQTAKLHRVLQYLADEFPDENIPAPYIWTGKSVFWFTDDDAAVVFKLSLPSI